jgi:hypothetical protein
MERGTGNRKQAVRARTRDEEGGCLEKKDATNGLAVRGGRPVTQTTSGLENLLHNRNKYTIA